MDEKIGDLITPEQAMHLAIRVAYKGAAFVAPNPLVGCVIVDRNHHLLATGFHARYGADHAEVDALKKIKTDDLKNATLYVTLEPCAHEGKTPSCAKHIASLPIKKVVYGLTDPNPLVSGQGAEILKAAGKTVVLYEGPLKSDLEDVCEVFLKNFREKKVFVAAKVASTLDGQIALKTGESKWITGEESRAFVHELRARYDALVVGRMTIEVDNPSLNVRHPTIQKESKIIVLDPMGTLLQKVDSKQNFKFLETHQSKNIFFATQNIKPDSKWQQIQMSSLIDLNDKLWELGIRSVFIEGGALTYSSYLSKNLIDRLHLFMAASILGSKNAVSWTSELGVDKLDQKINLKNLKIKQFKNDIYMTGRL